MRDVIADGSNRADCIKSSHASLSLKARVVLHISLAKKRRLSVIYPSSIMSFQIVLNCFTELYQSPHHHVPRPDCLQSLLVGFLTL